MTIAARAPGRVNLIGEHTDYNDGFVLPLALAQQTTVSLARAQTVQAEARDDRSVTVDATDLRERDSFDLDAIERTSSWRDYVRGVVELLAPERGADLRVESNVPRGAGLSSSAALLQATKSSIPPSPRSRVAAADCHGRSARPSAVFAV